MAEYGFTGSDIASITSARAGLTAGFMQLGRQIQEDIQRIATVREMRAFGTEMAQLDPTQDAFPQQLIGTLSKYPLASQTPLAKQGIEVLGTRYKAAIEAKQQTAPFLSLGGGVQYDPKRGVAYRTTQEGQTEFIDATPQDRAAERGVIINEPSGQRLVSPSTGTTIATFETRPASTRSTNLNVLPENVKMQIRFMDDDARAVQTERQKLVDSITNGTIGSKERPAAIQRQKELESQLQNIKDTRDRILSEAAAAQSERMGMPSGAGQGVSGPSLMPTGQPSSFVPMPVPAAPNQIPVPSQMVQNTDQGAVLPDQLPVLPNVRPTVKQLSGPRLYRIEGGKFKADKNNLKKAAEQAFADQAISEDLLAKILQQAGP